MAQTTDQLVAWAAMMLPTLRRRLTDTNVAVERARERLRSERKAA